MSNDPVSRFLRLHRAAAVGQSPVRPEALNEEEEKQIVTEYDFEAERALTDWEPITPSEAPAKRQEYPERFIDGSHLSQPVLCLRSPAGYPVPMLVGQVGAVALKLENRRFTRVFHLVESVLGMVVDPFPWSEIEEFSIALENHPRLPLRFLSARQAPDKSPFDYEAMRLQAYNRMQNEMTKQELIALSADPEVPTLVDGQLWGRISEAEAKDRPLLVGSVKTSVNAPLHPQGWQTLLDLRATQRTPYFEVKRTPEGKFADIPLACWYLRLASGPKLAPNWGIVRIDIPWSHLDRVPASDRSGFVNRLSRWLVDASCRADSYSRRPVSLEPIVRAEDSLKPLFTPLPVLINRLYCLSGLIRRNHP